MAGGVEFRIRPFRDGDEDDVVELWRACELVRPWNDPRRDIECARAGPSSEVFVAVAGEGAGRGRRERHWPDSTGIGRGFITSRWRRSIDREVSAGG